MSTAYDLTTEEHLAATASAAGAYFEGASPQEILGWAIEAFGEHFAITSSMGETVLMHMAAQVRPGVAVLFLDTGYHFAETVGTRDAVAARDVEEHLLEGDLIILDEDLQGRPLAAEPLTLGVEQVDLLLELREHRGLGLGALSRR